MQHERIIQQQCLSKGFMFRVQAWLITNTQRFMHVWVSVRKIVTRSSIFKQIFAFSRNAYLANVLDAISSYYKFKISKARQCLPVQTLAYANKENKHRASFFFFNIALIHICCFKICIQVSLFKREQNATSATMHQVATNYCYRRTRFPDF